MISWHNEDIYCDIEIHRHISEDKTINKTNGSLVCCVCIHYHHVFYLSIYLPIYILISMLAPLYPCIVLWFFFFTVWFKCIQIMSVVLLILWAFVVHIIYSVWIGANCHVEHHFWSTKRKAEGTKRQQNLRLSCKICIEPIWYH